MRKDNWNPWTVWEKVTLSDLLLGWKMMKDGENGLRVPSFKFGTHTIISRFDPKRTTDLARLLVNNPDTTRKQGATMLGVLNKVGKGKSSNDDSFLRLCYCLITLKVFFNLHRLPSFKE